MKNVNVFLIRVIKILKVDMSYELVEVWSTTWGLVMLFPANSAICATLLVISMIYAKPQQFSAPQILRDSPRVYATKRAI